LTPSEASWPAEPGSGLCRKPYCAGREPALSPSQLSHVPELVGNILHAKLFQFGSGVPPGTELLDSMHTHSDMMRFDRGDQVCFETPGRGKQFGVLVKHNRKTVTVVTESGQKWNASPHLLSKAMPAGGRNRGSRKVIDLKKR